MASTAPPPSNEPTPPPTITATPTQPVKSAGAGRLPSLNQLAARIGNKADANASVTSSSSSARPRLAAFALRTGSSGSTSTVASSADSLAVNPSTTRAASPGSTPTTANSTTGTPSNDSADGATANIDGGEALTAEKLEKLNLEGSGGGATSPAAVNGLPGSATSSNAPTHPPERQKKVGYKNIPSLDAITARLVKTRALSIDGTAKPPEPPMIEDPKTPGVQMKAPEHPLQYAWTIYHDTKAKFPYTPGPGVVSQPGSAAPDGSFNSHPPESTDYEAGLTVIGEFSTVEEFCRYLNWLKPPSKLDRNSNYHLFKTGIKPMWEDEANANGGKWVLTMKNNPILLDRCWSFLAMALVGEDLEEGDEICGAVVSLRSKVDRIQLWTRSKEDVEKLNGIGKKLVKTLDVSEADGIGLEFQYNTEDRPLPNKFLSISSMPNTSFRAGFPTPQATNPRPFAAFTGGANDASSPASAGPGAANAGAGGAFGSFGVGIGGWKATKRP
ncbi:translation initiation factor eIF4e [Pluteus cervinus]|uniref:Translation initiation factor eIF4e n=1 Tax=Pluteus cervinus TaxID=181527 RepID=A0ACD3AWX6_9AGAR|nr:translation initiation factor eIF4e [Pluteus cervinus]